MKTKMQKFEKRIPVENLSLQESTCVWHPQSKHPLRNKFCSNAGIHHSRSGEDVFSYIKYMAHFQNSTPFDQKPGTIE